MLFAADLYLVWVIGIHIDGRSVAMTKKNDNRLKLLRCHKTQKEGQNPHCHGAILPSTESLSLLELFVECANEHLVVFSPGGNERKPRDTDERDE